MNVMMKSVENKEATKILNIYRFFQKDGSLYLTDDVESLDMLFDAVINAIENCGPLKPQLPYNEFVRPSRKVLEGDAGWVGHFEERDNRRFFLSDIYDYLRLMYGRKG
ncbi:MAG: hypothetical protein PF439_01460 [Helicobacteraceae bacterium]|jgi:hypothetical protein|nr:hypothetical protein [Helicobacteraceae bacterium]